MTEIVTSPNFRK